MKVKNTLQNINPFVVKYFMNHVALRETLQINAPKSPIAIDENFTWIDFYGCDNWMPLALSKRVTSIILTNQKIST